ncbi:signal peptide peptidase SppA [Candidatus Dependentiae bacterium]|nr:signal peptide peptidase SppA [Candidatus Dependentiae bacterium]
MSTNKREQKKAGFFEIIKNLFWLLLFLQFAPAIFSSLRKTIEEVVVPKTHVGHLKITGLISDSSYYVKHIQKFLKAPHIKALYLKIDSPGGFPGSAQAVFNELKKFKEKKPIIAFIENMGTSAAYNIAAAANHIVAAPSALVGSIGVWLQVPPNIKYLGEDWKIKFRTIQSGAYKTAGSPFKDMTLEETTLLQSVSDDSYNQFVKDIAQSRNISIKNHKIWADGKVFTGNQALSLKLIDQIGSQQDALDILKKEAMVEKEEEIKLVLPPRPSKFMRMFGAEADTDPDSGFSSFMASFVSEVIQKVSTKTAGLRLRA